MKQLFAALALCAATGTQSSEIGPIELPYQSIQPPVVELSPDFSFIKIDHAREYVKKIYPLAKIIQEKHRIPVSVTIAIACVESGYGRSHYAQTRNNHMGIRVYKNGQAGYRTFDSTAGCFNYFSGMFAMERYQPLKELNSEDPAEWIRLLCECGYNHREHYIHKIIKMIHFIDLDKLDQVIA